LVLLPLEADGKIEVLRRRKWYEELKEQRARDIETKML
jgi:hypothetical protein